MKLKRVAKFGKDPTRRLKIGIRNLTKFDSSTRKSQKFSGLLLRKVYILWAKKVKGIIFHEIEERYKIWRGIDLPFQNWNKEFDKIWPEHLKVSKIFILISSFWAKDILFQLKKYRGVLFHETEEGYKIWWGIDLLFQRWHKEFDKF